MKRVKHLVFMRVMTAKIFSADLEIILVQSVHLQTQCIKCQIFCISVSLCFIRHYALDSVFLLNLKLYYII